MKPEPKRQNLAETQRPPTPAQILLERLLQLKLLHQGDWDALPTGLRQELAKHSNAERLLARLVQERLLTEYQAGRVRGEKIHGLILDSYRVLDRLGVGNMGVVFRAEHLQTRRQLAIKVLIPTHASDTKALLRFCAERKTIAQLRHPNIARALDVGATATPDPDQPMLYYYAMEYFPGEDLEKHVRQHGPLAPGRACEIAYQVASALTEAHRHHLVHRDIEPANILVTADGPVKLLDFGLVRQFSSRQTEPGTLLGTLDYLAPEQAADASTVDIRADLYSLGGCLFWALAGKAPYAALGALGRDLAQRQTTPPPPVRSLRPEVPAELDLVVSRMLALNREQRYPTPHAVLEALAPFLPADSPVGQQRPAPPPGPSAQPEPAPPAPLAPHPPRALIIALDSSIRTVCEANLEKAGFACAEALTSDAAVETARAQQPDLIVLDDDLPGATGLAVLGALHTPSVHPHQKIIVLLRAEQAEGVTDFLAAGADDYLVKPLDAATLQLRVKTALALKEAQEKADHLSRQLAAARAAPAPPPPPQEPEKSWFRKFFGK